MDMVALELIKNLQLIDAVNEYVIFVKPDQDCSCIPTAPNFKIVELKGGPYPIWEQIALPLAAHRAHCDLLHCTSNTGPIWSKVPLITTLHDIIYLESISIFKKSGTWYQKFGNLYRRWIVPTVVRKSKRVVTVSEFEKERIQKFMDLGSNLFAIYNGVGEHFKKIENPQLLLNAKNKYQLPENFLFFLGNTDPKKNTPNVLKAFAIFNQRHHTKHKLVMLDYEEGALLQVLNDIGHPEIRQDIFMLGYVPNLELPAIINQCRLFLYPSLRESFGIPILEGMACGVPVITSNTASMPEIAGDAAAIVDPNNFQEIVEAIIKISDDKKYRELLISKGIDRAGRFSWSSMAKGYLGHYNEILMDKKSKR